MTVQKFIAEYNNAKDKEKYIQSHIVKDYIPFSNKLVIINKLASASTHDNETQKYIQNSPLQYVMFLVMLVKNYTDIIISDNLLSDFDALDRNGLIDEIINAVPEREYVQCDAIFKMCLDDILQNEYSMQAFLEKKFNMFGEILDSLEAAMQTKE